MRQWDAKNSRAFSLSELPVEVNWSAENVILRCLSELVRAEDWYELDLIHRHAVDFIKQQGLNVGMLSKDRLGKLIHDLDVISDKDRRVVQSRKITVYLISPEKVKQVALNYRVQ